MNERALETIELSKNESFEIKPITPDGVRACLQLLQYGGFEGEYDGAYQYNPVLSPLVVVDEIILVTVATLRRRVCLKRKSFLKKVKNKQTEIEHV